MPDYPLPCPRCAGTGWATHEDRHAETVRDRCTTCGGTGLTASHTGETREGSFDPETGRAFGEPVTTPSTRGARHVRTADPQPRP